ncbi:hypothetical protein [Acidaminococcus timonensis]|uniref:hypothetical protein n=1 Tax=Acidaminococcus timonensis TaxID=1871002 RepID=UPI00248AA44C|nr:hypothetical protein [Acidaminococcus timonensis]
MDKVQLGKLIWRQRKDLLFGWFLFFNIVTSLATPAVDWYVPLKLVLLFWLASGVWLTIPVLGRYQKRSFAWKLAIIALVLGLVTLLPASWPLRVEYPGLELWFWAAVPFAWYSLWNFFGWQKMRQARGILWTLWPVLLLAGASWAVLDPDFGALGASFLQQLFYGALGFEYLRCGAHYQHRLLFTGGLLLVSAGFWMALNTFVWILPEPIYPILWGVACGVLEWIFPQLGK